MKRFFKIILFIYLENNSLQKRLNKQMMKNMDILRTPTKHQLQLPRDKMGVVLAQVPLLSPPPAVTQVLHKVQGLHVVVVVAWVRLVQEHLHKPNKGIFVYFI